MQSLNVGVDLTLRVDARMPWSTPTKWMSGFAFASGASPAEEKPIVTMTS